MDYLNDFIRSVRLGKEVVMNFLHGCDHSV